MNWIIKNDIAINLNQVTDVFFTPAAQGTDEEDDNKPFKIKARILFTLTSVEMEEKSDYNGTIEGVTATSRQIRFQGAEAEDVWLEFVRATGNNSHQALVDALQAALSIRLLSKNLYNSDSLSEIDGWRKHITNIEAQIRAALATVGGANNA